MIMLLVFTENDTGASNFSGVEPGDGTLLSLLASLCDSSDGFSLNLLRYRRMCSELAPFWNLFANLLLRSQMMESVFG